MTETSICSANATVMMYDERTGQWAPLGTSQGPSKVQVYHNKSNNNCRIIGWTLSDREVVLNYAIHKGLNYTLASSTFHHWWDGSSVKALQFSSEKEAAQFNQAILQSLDLLTMDLTGASSDLPMPPKSPAESKPTGSQHTQVNGMLQQQLQRGVSNHHNASDHNSLKRSASKSSARLSRSCSVPDKTPPTPVVTGGSGPPPPPPPPPMIQQKTAKSGGGLTAALQGAKLNSSKDVSSSDPPPRPPKLSMMEEMAAKLKRRQGQPTSPTKIDRPVVAEQQVAPSSPRPARVIVKSKSPSISKLQVKTVPPVSQVCKEVNTDLLGAFKSQLMAEIRDELQKCKQEIVTEILVHLQNGT